MPGSDCAWSLHSGLTRCEQNGTFPTAHACSWYGNFARVRAHPKQNGGASQLFQSRIVKKDIRLSASHEDFPPILAEVLDALWGSKLDLDAAQGQLGLSHLPRSALITLIAKEKRALAKVNHYRVLHGLPKLVTNAKNNTKK